MHNTNRSRSEPESVARHEDAAQTHTATETMEIGFREDGLMWVSAGTDSLTAATAEQCRARLGGHR